MEKQNSKMWDRFDYVGVLCYTGYLDRERLIKDELARVGLLDRCIFHLDFPNPFSGILSNKVSKTDYHRKLFPIGFGNYRIIKTAYELGKKNVLVLEDDVRFLKDLDELGKCITSLPDDFDIAMLDKNWPKGEWLQREKVLRNRVGTSSWYRFTRFFSSGCYAMSRSGMARWIGAYERDAIAGCLRNNDEYFSREVFGGDAHMYAAIPNLAVQTLIGSRTSSPLVGYWTCHEQLGATQESYNIETPVVNASNFLRYLYRALDRDVQKDAISKLRSGSIGFLALKNHIGDVVRNGTWKMQWTDSMLCDKCDCSFVWGNGSHSMNQAAVQASYVFNAPIILCEDGFIRSLTTPATQAARNRQVVSYSIIYDSSAYYFDALRRSTIEKMLNDSKLVLSEPMRLEARRLINKIVSNKISKYNHQPIFTPKIGREGVRKVLVVDQSYGDFSIKRGLADDSTFEKMLQAAIEENPDADILVKTHPDTMAGKKAEKKGYYQDLKEHDNIYKVTIPINPYSLMELCDKVYVCSSQFGLEALMAGKEVHVFGMPFYAGWGLTIDAQKLERRTKTRTLEELFYIFYCMYTHWVDPDKGCETTIDSVIDKMIALRDEASQKKKNGESIADSSSIDNGYRIGSKPKVYYGRRQQFDLTPVKKGWNW